MSHPGLFKDLGKRVSDLLTKEFPTEEKKVEFKGATINNVTVESTLTQKPDGSILGTLTPSYKYKPYGTTLTAEVNTKKEGKVEAVVENQLADGLKLTLTGEARGKNNFATLSTEYKHEYATFTGSVDYGKPNGSLLKDSVVFGSQGFALGLSAEYLLGTTDASELKTFNTTVSYTKPDFDITAFGRLISEKEKNEIGATYFQNVNSDVAVGAEVVFDTAHADSKPKLTFGTQYKLNTDTTVKAKFDTNGLLGLSYAQRFNKNSRFILGANVDTNNLSGKSSSTVGFTVALNL
jgi:hypothetical protein